MDPIDLEIFYAEQDERMNLPDEDFSGYLTRMKFKPERMRRTPPLTPQLRMQQLVEVEQVMSLPNLEPDCSAPEMGDTNISYQGSSTTSRYNIPQNRLENHASLCDFNIDFTLKSGGSFPFNTSCPSNESSPISTAGNLSGEHAQSVLIEDITCSNRTNKMKNAPLVPMKRKVPPDVRLLSPQPQKRLHDFSPKPQPRSISQNVDERSSPICSFPVSVNPERTDMSTHTHKSLAPQHPPTSPIEDVSSLASPSRIHATPLQRQKGRLPSEPRELYFEVKEKIAKSSRKGTKLGLKMTIRDNRMLPSAASSSPDGSDINYISSSASLRSTTPSSPKLLPKSSVSNFKDKLPANPKKERSKKQSKKKEKPPKMTPSEYARTLQAQLQEPTTSKETSFKFLSGKNIFYVGGDMNWASERTRGRMDIIVKHGGNLLLEYDPFNTTHIVTDATMLPTLRALGLKRLRDIPDHIPTIKWSWVLTGLGRAATLEKEELEAKLEDVWSHAAFSERIDAGVRKRSAATLMKKGKTKACDSGGANRISEFTEGATSSPKMIIDLDSEEVIEYSGLSTVQGPTSPTSLGDNPHARRVSSFKAKLTERVPASNIIDPLAEFYDLARAQTESVWSRAGEVQDSDTDEHDNDSVDLMDPVKKGWTCDRQDVSRTTGVNQDIIDKLQELLELHKTKPTEDDRWRVYSYSKCIRALRHHPKRIRSYSEARSIRGIGEKTALKITEIIETGNLRRIGYENTEDVKTIRLFQGIYGVGQSTAYQWYSAGCRTLDDIKARVGGVNLSSVQEIGIKFYDDINIRMPREEAKAIFDLVKPIALSIDPKLMVEIMGSYRRGKADCGDIDILITRPTDDGKTHAGVLPHLLRELHDASILSEDLALPENPYDLEAIYRGLCKLPENGSRRRRIDFLTIPWKSRGAALLYYTGDDIFNRAIRYKANAMGYSLNQEGLFAGVVRDLRDRRIKLNAGTVVASETEEEIFKILGVPWQEPHERVRN